ncbi:MAG: alpha/beta fold hydrolase [Pseudomonadota bacterium]
MLNIELMGTSDSPPVVVLHGLYGSVSNWRRVTRILSEDFQTVSVDLPNHGGSAWVDSMDYEMMASAVLEYLAANGLTRVSVIGHSMGGKVAMCMSQIASDRIEKLIVVDIAPVSYPTARMSEHSHLIDAMEALDLKSIGSRSEADSALLQAVPETQVRQFLLQNLRKNDGIYEWRINLRGIKQSLVSLMSYPALKKSPIPAMFLRGLLSDYILDIHRPAIDQCFSDWAMVDIAQVGHWLHAEKPEQVCQLTRDFFRPQLRQDN